MMDVSEDAKSGGESGLQDLIAEEIIRAAASRGDLDHAMRFVRGAHGRDFKRYQHLSRRMRRLVDLLIAAGHGAMTKPIDREMFHHGA